MQYPSKIGKQQWPQDWKSSVFISIPKKGNAKECLNYCTIALILHTSKVMLKILQAKLPQYTNQELSAVKLDLEKGEEPKIKLSIITIMEKSREFKKKKHPLLLH